jgi:phosphate transport system substrate-binding protein
MKWNRIIAVGVFTLCSLAQCFGHHIAVVVNKANSTENVPSTHLAQLFRHETTKWIDGAAVTPVVDTSSAGQMATLQRLNHMTAAELKAFLAAHKDEIRQLNSDADVLQAVESNPGAIGLVDVRSVNNRIKVVKVNGKLPLEEGYLSH